MRFAALVLLALTVFTTVAPHTHHSVASWADDAELAGRCEAADRGKHHFDSALQKAPSECVACIRQQQQMPSAATGASAVVEARDAAHAPYSGVVRSLELPLALLRAPPAA